MSKNSAEYMRAYRARKRALSADAHTSLTIRETIQGRRIAELEEEVRHLKAELASAHVWNAALEDPTFREGLDAGIAEVKAGRTRKLQQASRDAILRKINRGG